MKCLTILGTTSIQGYVFRSNRLKENVGASWLAARAIERKWEAEHGCRLIYAGGGNAALLFENKPKALEAVRKWSNALLDEAPGLRVVAAHVEVADGKEREAYCEAIKQLLRNENGEPAGAELGALPVVRNCASTGRAATRRYDQQWLGDEAWRKRRAMEGARAWQKEKWLKKRQKFVFPRELSELGTAEEASQIAIVHADGNGMGELFVAASRDESRNGESFFGYLSELSRKITQTTDDAFQTTIDDLAERLAGELAADPKAARPLMEAGVVPKPAIDDEDKLIPDVWYFPLQPLVHAGDDLTFVCHARLGLALAAEYLKHFESTAANHLGGSRTACAGVVILPQKFPFARAYEMAEEICAHAKQTRSLWLDCEGNDCSWMDYHLISEGAGGSVEFTRRLLYRNRQGNPLAVWRDGNKQFGRPYRVAETGGRTWTELEQTWRAVRDWPRSRAKHLMEAVAKGPEAVERYLTACRSRNWEPPVPMSGDDDYVAYFDALEILDFHVPVWMPVQGGDHAVPAN